MSDGYWRYGDTRQPPPTSSIPAKRPRPEYDAPGERGAPAYYPRDGDGVPRQTLRDTESINASYDRYLRSGHLSSHGGAESDRTLTSGLPSHSIEDPRMGMNPHIAGDHRFGMDPTTRNDSRISSMDPLASMKGHNFAIGSGRPEIPLPPDASNTLFVEGLPANCTRREVAHIFRPFVGYQEVRLVIKEAKYPGGGPAVLCFVDFASPAHAATALDALQGYMFDEHERDSSLLRLQFARNPGARSSGGQRGGHRGKR